VSGAIYLIRFEAILYFVLDKVWNNIWPSVIFC